MIMNLESKLRKFIAITIRELLNEQQILKEYDDKINVLNKNEIVDIIEKCNNENYIDAKLLLLKHPKILNLIHSSTTNQYIFQDYVWIIKKSVVHTCHRDNNGDFFNENQKHPSYTMLIYLEDMEKCLGIIPNSHKDLNSYNVNLFENVVNIPCKKGDVILFNANLIHVGCINKKDDNLRIQMKVSHKDDIDKLQYYQNFNKILNKDNNLPVFLRKGQLQFSCMFPILSNLTQNENIRTARGSDNGVEVGLPQKTFSYLFYGNPDFYDLPNAF
jgi:ectoine hydroxylase-related dioxygenase (phytanoyl-CoA dioxygenase family)